MVKSLVHVLCLTLTLLIVLSYLESSEAAKQKRMIIGFSGGRSGAINGNIKQDGELPTQAEISAAMKLAKVRLARHMSKKEAGTTNPTKLGNGARLRLK